MLALVSELIYWWCTTEGEVGVFYSDLVLLISGLLKLMRKTEPDVR